MSDPELLKRARSVAIWSWLAIFVIPFILLFAKRGQPLPAWASAFDTPDEVYPGMFYEPSVKALHDRWAWAGESVAWFMTMWYWLGERNKMNGLEMRWARETSGYFNPGLGEGQLGRVERTEPDGYVLWLEKRAWKFGLARVRGWRIYNVKGRFMAVPTNTYKRP